jgi:hypothetical protein
MFQERLSGVDEIKGCVDSAGVFAAPRMFSQLDGFTSNQPTLCADSDTSAWFFWRDNLPDRSEIRMGRWSALAGWSLGFESPYTSAQALDSPRAFTDAHRDIHLLFRRSGAVQLELVETVWHRATGVWDAGPSLLTTFKDEQLAGTAFGIDAVGRTHAAWLAASAAGRRLREMVRAAPAVAPVGVPDAPGPAALARVTAAPNPARGLLSLAIESSVPLPIGARAHVFNVAGREVAAVALGAGTALRATWDGTDARGARRARRPVRERGRPRRTTPPAGAWCGLAAARTLALGAMLVACAAGAPAHAARRVPADFASLQSALDASAVGDTVLVAAGTYLERVSLPAGVTLRAEGAPGSVVLDAGRARPGRRDARRRARGRGRPARRGRLHVRRGAGDVRRRDRREQRGGPFHALHVDRRGGLIWRRALPVGRHADDGPVRDHRRERRRRRRALRHGRCPRRAAVDRDPRHAGDRRRRRHPARRLRAHASEPHGRRRRGRGQGRRAGDRRRRPGDRDGNRARRLHLGARRRTVPPVVRARALRAGTHARGHRVRAAGDDALRPPARARRGRRRRGDRCRLVPARQLAGRRQRQRARLLDPRATLDVVVQRPLPERRGRPVRSCVPTESGNMALDPHLCDLAGRDFGLCANSPLVAPACGSAPWGAGVQTCGDCGPTPARAITWGGVKALYRD